MRAHFAVMAMVSSLVPTTGRSADTLRAAESQHATASECPGAEAWREAHPDESGEAIEKRDAMRHFSMPDLRSELEARFNLDQKTRRQYLVAPQDPNLRAAIARMDDANLVWLKKMIRAQGVPTAEQVGENGVKWTWLLAQHADARLMQTAGKSA